MHVPKHASVLPDHIAPHPVARFAAGSENARVAARRWRLSAHPAPRSALSRAGRPRKQSTTAGPVASKLSAPSSAVGGESSRIGVRVGRPRERTGPGAASAGEARSDPQARKQSGPVPTDWKPHVGTSAPERGGRERVRWGACAGVPPGATLAYTGRSFRGRRRRSAGDGADAMGGELFRRDVWRRGCAPRQKAGCRVGNARDRRGGAQVERRNAYLSCHCMWRDHPARMAPGTL
jgi:hypothetical protein